MEYNNSLHYTAQPVLNIGLRQRFRSRKATGLPGGSALWWSAVKVALAVFAVALCLNLWLGSVISGVDGTIRGIETQRHLLKDEQIGLLAERASLMSEKQVQVRAAEKLALYVPEQEQVYKLR